MAGFKELYHKHIYGLMGTIIFHILLFAGFLISEIDFKHKVKEEAIIIDFSTPDEIKLEKPQEKKTEDKNAPSTQRDRSAAISNRAVNDAQKKDNSLDKEYLKEVQAAQQLVKDVNRQLSKKVVDKGDFDMPAITTEGVDPDSIKNVIYSGKSNIHYFLKNRYHVSLRNPVYLARGGGEITVDIAVGRDGNVIKAEPRAAGTVGDPLLSDYAQQAALHTVFNTDRSAPKVQTGTITYTFVAQ